MTNQVTCSDCRYAHRDLDGNLVCIMLDRTVGRSRLACEDFSRLRYKDEVVLHSQSATNAGTASMVKEHK